MAGFVVLVAGAGLALTAFAQLWPLASAKNLVQTGLGLFAMFQSACTRQSNIKKARHKGELATVRCVDA